MASTAQTCTARVASNARPWRFDVLVTGSLTLRVVVSHDAHGEEDSPVPSDSDADCTNANAEVVDKLPSSDSERREVLLQWTLHFNRVRPWAVMVRSVLWSAADRRCVANSACQSYVPW